MGMPRPKKRKVDPSPAEEEVVFDSGDSGDELSSLDPSLLGGCRVTAPGPRSNDLSLERAQMKYLKSKALRKAFKRKLKEADSQIKLEERLYGAKMRRFSEAVKRNKSSPLGQLERRYGAEIQWYKALWKHEMTRSLAREAERDEYKALPALREAEVAVFCVAAPAMSRSANTETAECASSSAARGGREVGGVIGAAAFAAGRTSRGPSRRGGGRGGSLTK